MQSITNNLPGIIGYVQVVLSVLIVAGILLQQRGQGLGSAFGGSAGGEFSTRRGAEKFTFRATIMLVVIFLALSVFRLTL